MKNKFHDFLHTLKRFFPFVFHLKVHFPSVYVNFFYPTGKFNKRFSKIKQPKWVIFISKSISDKQNARDSPFAVEKAGPCASFAVSVYYFPNQIIPLIEAQASTGGFIHSRSRRSGLDGSGGSTTPALEYPCGMRCDTYPVCGSGRLSTNLASRRGFLPEPCIPLAQSFYYLQSSIIGNKPIRFKLFCKKNSQLNFETFRLIALHGMSDNEC